MFGLVKRSFCGFRVRRPLSSIVLWLLSFGSINVVCINSRVDPDCVVRCVSFGCRATAARIRSEVEEASPSQPFSHIERSRLAPCFAVSINSW